MEFTKERVQRLLAEQAQSIESKLNDQLVDFRDVMVANINRSAVTLGHELIKTVSYIRELEKELEGYRKVSNEVLEGEGKQDTQVLDS